MERESTTTKAKLTYLMTGWLEVLLCRFVLEVWLVIFKAVAKYRFAMHYWKSDYRKQQKCLQSGMVDKKLFCNDIRWYLLCAQKTKMAQIFRISSLLLQLNRIQCFQPAFRSAKKMQALKKKCHIIKGKFFYTLSYNNTNTN